MIVNPFWSFGVGWVGHGLKEGEWLGWRNLAWGIGITAVATPWGRAQVISRAGWVGSGLWTASNFVRIGAPMATGARTGIGFGAAAGGTGAGTAVAGVAAAAVGGAIVGTAISGLIWGEKGASEAAGFYTGGRLGEEPNYVGTMEEPGYFNIPGNLGIILRHYVPELGGGKGKKTFARRILGW